MPAARSSAVRSGGGNLDVRPLRRAERDVLRVMVNNADLPECRSTEDWPRVQCLWVPHVG